MQISLKSLKQNHACQDGIEFASKCNFDPVLIWNTCERGDWLWWMLRKYQLPSKEQSIAFAQFCAKNAKSYAYAADAAYAAAAYAYAADAAYAAAAYAYAYAAAYAAAAYAYAYAADAAYAAAAYAAYAAAERKCQADWLRSNIHPFQS